MNNFNYLWTFLITCAYFQTSPGQVTAYHPKKDISRIKQIASYMIWMAGGTHRDAAELTGTKTAGARCNIYLVRDLMEFDEQLRNDVNNLATLLNR